MGDDHLKLCNELLHGAGFSCARCNRTYCMTCDRSADDIEIKTVVRYCQDWRCQRELSIENGSFDGIPEHLRLNMTKVKAVIDGMKAEVALLSEGVREAKAEAKCFADICSKVNSAINRAGIFCAVTFEEAIDMIAAERDKLRGVIRDRRIGR